MLNLTLSNNCNSVNATVNDNITIAAALKENGMEVGVGSKVLWNGQMVDDTEQTIAQVNAEIPTPEGRNPRITVVVALKNA